MRDSLKKSAADSPVSGFERYPKGSIVICNACLAPIFKLDAGIALGDKGGASAKYFKPLSVADLSALMVRTDVDAGLRAVLQSWSPVQQSVHVSRLREMRAGDPMQCPSCGDCFVQIISVEKAEALDRSFTIELVTIPPEEGRAVAIRGRRLGYRQEWVH